MKAAKLRRIFIFGLLLLCLGCAPVLARSDIPGQEKISTPVATQSKPTPKGGKFIIVTVDPLTAKTPQAPILEYPLTSGEKLALKGGLTDEARQILQSGKTGYFILTFATPGAPSNIQDLKDAGFIVLGHGEYVEAPPATLEVLEAWSQNGRIVFCGTIPPKGKIDPKINEAIRTSTEGSVEISVYLLKIPDEAEKKQIEKLFKETKWPLYKDEVSPFFSGIIEGKNIERLSEIPIVRGIEIPHEMRSN